VHAACNKQESRQVIGQPVRCSHLSTAHRPISDSQPTVRVRFPSHAPTPKALPDKQFGRYLPLGDSIRWPQKSAGMHHYWCARLRSSRARFPTRCQLPCWHPGQQLSLSKCSTNTTEHADDKASPPCSTKIQQALVNDPTGGSTWRPACPRICFPRKSATVRSTPPHAPWIATSP
jgi:hypothetical protein